MLVTGVVREMTAASAKRAALGAGAIVMDTLASNDKRKPHEQIQRIRELRPDMMLMSGGTDGGTITHVVQTAELIAPAKPQPRFGGQYRMPVIFAGLRLGVAAGFVGVVLAELLITPTGIGDLITFHRSRANYAEMYATIASIIALSTLTLVALQWIETRVFRPEKKGA